MAQDMKTLQKSTFIVTVQLGHIDKKTNWDEVDEVEQIEELVWHWRECLKLPNLKIARGQIERSPTTGRLHIQAALKFKKVWRARTLENKWGCWAEPALKEDNVMDYAKKTETRVQELENFGTLHKKKTGAKNPKQKAIDMLVQGFTPEQICMVEPAVFFTHHRAIVETYKMLTTVRVNDSVHGILEEE